MNRSSVPSRFIIRIYQVENGYIVQEGDGYVSGSIPHEWVAGDIPELTTLIGELAAGVAEFPVGVRPGDEGTAK